MPFPILLGLVGLGGLALIADSSSSSSSSVASHSSSSDASSSSSSDHATSSIDSSVHGAAIELTCEEAVAQLPAGINQSDVADAIAFGLLPGVSDLASTFEKRALSQIDSDATIAALLVVAHCLRARAAAADKHGPGIAPPRDHGVQFQFG